MAAQAAWATDFLENATQRISLDTRTKVNEALSSLRQIVEMQSKSSTSMDARFPYRRQMPTKGLRALAMPPVHSTVSALRNIKGMVISPKDFKETYNIFKVIKRRQRLILMTAHHIRSTDVFAFSNKSSPAA